MTDDQAGDAAVISLSPYDPQGAMLFEDERASLEVALADWLVGLPTAA